MTSSVMDTRLMTAPPRMPRLLGRALAFEWTKLTGVRATWINAGLALLGTIGLSVLFGISLRYSAQNGMVDQPVPAAAFAYQSLLMTQALIIAIVTLFVTSEYASGSINTTLQAVPQRGRLLASKALIGLGVGAVAGFLLAAIGTLVARPTGGAWTTLQISDLIRASLGSAAYLGVLSAFVVGIAFAMRSTAGTLVTVLVFLYVVPQVLPAFGVEWLTTVANYLPFSTFAVLALGVDQPYSWPTAAVVLVAWAAAALLLGYVLLRRRDAR